MSVYTAVQTIAQSKNISIHRIEKDLSMSNGAISKWNKSDPIASNLQKVADYLGVSTTFILNKSKES